MSGERVRAPGVGMWLDEGPAIHPGALTRSTPDTPVTDLVAGYAYWTCSRGLTSTGAFSPQLCPKSRSGPGSIVAAGTT